MFCINCGKEIPDGSKFCPHCGAQMPAASGGQQQYNQQQYNQQQYNQQNQYNQQTQQAAQSVPPAGQPGKGGFLIKLGIGVAAAMFLIIAVSMFMGGDDDHGSSGSGKTGSTQTMLPDPNSVISLEDFNWLYNARSHDSSKDVPVTEAYSPTGVWKVTIMRKPSKKDNYRKELYLLDLDVQGRPRVVGSEAGAMDVYGYQGFLNSDEAKEAGLDQNNTAGDLLSALAEGDGTLPCTGTLLLLLVEDEKGNMVQPKKETVIYLTGRYSPSRAILQLEDEKGNRYGTHAFVKAGEEEHCQGAYTSSKKDPVLGGMIDMCRDIE